MSFEIEAENVDMYAVFRAFEKPQDNGTTETRALQLLARLRKPAIIKDEEGRTLLHLACINGWNKVADELINKHFCVPTRNSTQYGTPLHQACAGGHLELVSRLVLDESCDPNCKSGDGTTPLHYACSNGKIDVARFLINGQGCNVNCKSDCGATPLHFACAGGHIEMVQCLLELQCDSTCTDKIGSTPLHYACSYGHLDVAKYLATVQEYSATANDTKNDGATPLHEACANGHLDIAKFLTKEQNSDPNSKDRAGWTPLHYACHNHGHMDVVQFLIEEYKCDPTKCKSNNGTAPLHSACAGGNINIVKYLIHDHKCSPTRAIDNDGITPLHKACSGGYLDIVQYLIREKGCDPESADNSNATPLHYACSNGYLDVVKYLILDKGCLKEHRSNDGLTPLKRACIGGHLDVVKFLVDECSCNIKDNNWYLPSPVQLAYNHNHIYIVAYLLIAEQNKLGTVGRLSKIFRSQRRNLSIEKLAGELLHHPFFKIFVVGEAEVGKSTLIKALQNKLSETNQFTLFRSRTVTGIKPLTAGIIPIYIERPSGSIILYDLAGQPEYYSSHAALLQALVSPLETLVLIVVKLTESIESMVSTLHYWSCMITSLCQNEQEQRKLPSVIIVGSYADEVPNHDVAEQKLSDACGQVRNNIVAQAQRIVLNCTRLRSTGLRHIFDTLSQQSIHFQKAVPIDIQVNFVNLLIKKYLSDKVACRFSEIAELNGLDTNSNLRNNGLLPDPSDNATLCKHIATLSDHGRLLFLKNEEDINSSWVILKVDELLPEVNGTIFAPQNFKQHHDISSNTGVVPYSKIREFFFSYDPRMIIDFLLHFEFCHKISEIDALHINSERRKSIPKSSESCYYFFPALVTVNKPENTGRSIIEHTHYRSGWFLECQGNNTFSSQFLHVLLIRLAFTFALDLPVSSNQDNPVIQRECNVWTSGIHWQNTDGVEAIVEVAEQHKVVVLMIGCSEGSEIAYVKLRSDIIRTILQVKSEFSGAVEAREYLIHQLTELGTYPLLLTERLSKFPIENLARAVQDEKKLVTYKEGSHFNKIEISSALYFEPYACLKRELIVKLYDESLSHQEVSDTDLSSIACDSLCPQIFMAFLKEILHYNRQQVELDIKREFPDDPKRQCYYLLITWKNENLIQATYIKLKAILDHCSVFCGRNPLQL